ncbi:MAG: DUF2141 domain-containing protein [Bacteroidetes bacterium]|jgi:uncharacterized protein (DUF2141 family)|nr:DUF2141 domain-containing protein [Bacteroidota bacterium]
MKTIGILLFTLLTIGVVAQSQSGVSVRVDIENFKSNKGKAFVALYDSEKNWLKKRSKGEIIAIQDQTATVVFEDVPAGTYAVSLFHDENRNGKMDANIFGIPKEPTACSNNATGRFGPPTWDDASFAVEDAPLNLKIQF